VNGTYINITDSLLPAGAVSTKNIFYCLTSAVGLLHQSYTTSANGAWQIEIVAALALIVPARRKKKAKEIKKEFAVEYMLQTISSLKEKFNLSLDEISELIESEKLKEEKVIIPISIFTIEQLGPAESLVKYMKENLNMKFSEIAKILNRDDRTIWATYSNAHKKMKHQIEKTFKEKALIPVSALADRKLSLLESVVKFLKEKNIENIEIARLLHKDPRNIYTFYSRMRKKLLL
jgi:DNA-binding CsgD family transcriptional regulator